MDACGDTKTFIVQPNDHSLDRKDRFFRINQEHKLDTNQNSLFGNYYEVHITTADTVEETACFTLGFTSEVNVETDITKQLSRTFSHKFGICSIINCF